MEFKNLLRKKNYDRFFCTPHSYNFWENFEGKRNNFVIYVSLLRGVTRAGIKVLKNLLLCTRERERERHLGVGRAGSAIMENHIRVSWGENFLLMH